MKDIDPQLFLSGVAFISRPGQVSAPAEDCRPRTSSNGGRVYICSSYALDPFDPPDDVTVLGYFRGTADAGTDAWIKVDGSEARVANRPDFRGVFADVKSVTFRACKAGICGPYS